MIEIQDPIRVIVKVSFDYFTGTPEEQVQRAVAAARPTAPFTTPQIVSCQWVRMATFHCMVHVALLYDWTKTSPEDALSGALAMAEEIETATIERAYITRLYDDPPGGTK